MFKKKLPVESYAETFRSTFRVVAQSLPRAMEADVVPNTETGKCARAAILSNADIAVLTYAIFRAWVLRSRMKRELQGRFLFHVDSLIAHGLIFEDADIDALALQEFWYASRARAGQDDKSIDFGASECFLERLRAGGLHGEDAFRALPLAVAFAGVGRILDADYKQTIRKYKLC